MEKKQLDEVKADIRKNIKRYQNIPTRTGGQSCGMPYYPMVLESPDLEIKIEVGYHRSQLRNWELCQTLFELAMDDLVK